MRTTLPNFLALIAILLASAHSARFARAAQPATRPHIVIFLADDLGGADVGWRGSPIRTPNLDRLANAGAKLDAFYVLPVCSPTRAALLTGRHPFRYGLSAAVVRPWATYGLPLDERTLPRALRDAGYETAIVGKWHLGHAAPEYLPTARGFEHQYGHYNGGLDYFTHDRDGGHDWHRNDRRSDDKGYSTELLGTEAVRLIEQRDKTRPLFLYVPFQAVHSPYQVPEQYSQPYDVARPRKKAYMGMVAALDEQVGRILAALQAAGMADNTLILFASDNGGPLPNTVTSNGDLRAGKGTVYEGGIRVVASATWPAAIPAGSTVTAPLHIVDIYTTALTLAGATLDGPKPLDGLNILPLLKGEPAPPREELILNITPTFGALRAGDWKLVVNGSRHIDEEALAPDPKTDRPPQYELFNLATDRAEQHDLSKEHPEILARLKSRYAELAKTAAPALGGPRPANFQSPKVWGEFPTAAPATAPASRP